MNFELTEEQRILRDIVRRISEKEFAPRAAKVDEEESFPWDNKKILEENGLLGIQVPVEYGGAGAGMVSLAITVEEVARACASTSTILTTQALASDPVLIGGSHEQKLKWLKPMADGSMLGACAITEPGAGSDVTSIRTTASPCQGGFRLNGTKIFITNGGVSDLVIVVAYTDKGKGHRGISMLIVPKQSKGISVGKAEKKLGIRGSDTRELIFEDCFVPGENLLGGMGDGFKILMQTFNFTRPCVAAQALGIAQGALDAVIEYCKNRVQFGRKLTEFQGIQWMVAEMDLKIELARTMIYRVCSTIDNKPNSREIPKLASMSKWYASDVAMDVTTNAVQLFGGYGYSREFPVERMMRDAKITQIYEGTNQVQRIIISNHILR